MSSKRGIYSWLPILKRDEYLAPGRFVYIYAIDVDAIEHTIEEDPDPTDKGSVPESWIVISSESRITSDSVRLIDRVTISTIEDAPE